MIQEVVVVKGLLDHQEVERVELAKHAHVPERVRGVRVDRQQDIGVRPTNGSDALDVGAGLDLQLDPPIPLREVAGDLLEEALGGRGDADGDATDHPFAFGAEERCEGTVLGAQRRVHERVDDRRLRHRVTSRERENALDAADLEIPAASSAGARKSRSTSQAPSFHSSE